MDCKPDCVFKGIRSDTTLDVERVHDVVLHGTVDAGVSKNRKHARPTVSLRTIFSLLPIQGSTQGSSTKRRKIMETKKILVDMLLRSNLILRNTERLLAMTEVLLQEIPEDMHDLAS
jgi:hypothetical protein